MKVMELFVDSHETDTEDGYTLLIDDSYEMSIAVNTALKNGYTDIRIRPAKKEYIAESNLYYKTDFEIGV